MTKVLGTLHGLFGVLVILLLFAASPSKGLFAELSLARASLKFLGSAVGGAFLLLTMWAAWWQPHLAALFAWASVVAYIFTAIADEIYAHGLPGAFNLMPTFYGTVLVRSVAAWSIGVFASGASTG